MAEPSPNRGGRPPLAIKQQRTHAVTVRFTAAEARALKRRAARRSCTVAALVREDLARVPDAVLGAGTDRKRRSRRLPHRAAPRRPPAQRRGPRGARLARAPRPGNARDALRRTADAVGHELGRWP